MLFYGVFTMDIFKMYDHERVVNGIGSEHV